MVGKSLVRMNRLNVIIIILSYTSIAFSQNVYVTPGTTSKLYHKSSDCNKLKSVGSSSFSISIQQAKSIGKEACDICYSAKAVQNKKNTAQSSTNPEKKSERLASNAYSNIEIPQTSSKVKSQVITHLGYTTSYNSFWLIPNWVAYCLTAQEVAGRYPRPQKPFEPDPLVKGKTSVHRDYSNSGYSRGHMAPAADMKWSEQAMMESFYLSNICPQSVDLNGGIWERLEKRCRALASEANLYICCGPLVSGTPKRIGENKVAVPTGFYKVLCMRRNGRWQAIGFMFPNTSCKGSMFDYSCSVDEVENATGHDFFYNLPNDIENMIESSYNIKEWQ